MQISIVEVHLDIDVDKSFAFRVLIVPLTFDFPKLMYTLICKPPLNEFRSVLYDSIAI
jgi:hypothetical protein